jgi:uncharacterized protein (TIRG00374 family)
MSGAHRKRTWLRAALRIGTSVSILALLFLILPVNELATTLRRIPVSIWLLTLAGYLTTHSIGITKWRLMVNSAGAGISFRQAAHCYLGGLFGNVFLPSIVGGDVIRAGLALRRAERRTAALLGSLLDRLLDIAALALLAGFGALMLPRTLGPQFRRVFLLLAVLAVAGIVTAVVVVSVVPVGRFSFRMRRRFVRLRQAAREMYCRPQYVLLALGLGLVAQSSFALLTASIAGACGLNLPVRAWLLAWPLAKISALIPATQGGMGVREVALSALLAPFGARPAMTVAVGLLWETIIISGGLCGGILSYVLGRRSRIAVASSQVSLAPVEPRIEGTTVAPQR